jgi:hypothetical protein
MNLYVQFSDDTMQVITSLFSGPQDPAEYPNQDVIASTDPRYVAYYYSMPEWFRPYLPSPT